jgi:hypothetical protein
MIITYAPDFSRDLLSVYGLSTMTLKVEGQDDLLLEDAVHTEPVAWHEMEPTDAQVPQGDQWMVWPKILSPMQPPLGSMLVDSDENFWTILAYERRKHIETWRAHCRNLSIIPSVLNQATLLKAEYRKGRANEAKPVWKGCFSGQSPPTADDVLTVRFQPAVELAQIRYSAEWSRYSYRVIFEHKPNIQLASGEHRLLDSVGNRYRILEIFDAQRLDRLPCALVVRIIEGAEYFGAGAPAPLPPPQFPS